MMEIGSILFWILACVLVVKIFDRRPASPVTPELSPRPEPDNTDTRTFSWERPGISQSYHLQTTVKFRPDVYNQAKQELMDTSPSKVHLYSEQEYFDVAEKEILHDDYGAFNYELTQVADYLNEFANRELLSEYEFAGIILGFTQEQCIPYQYDDDSTGYPEYLRFPLETIADTTGDCDCKAILACALFKTLGYRVAFALMPGHAAMLVTLQNDDLPFANFTWNGKRWFYCETTGDYWSPGQLPDGIDASSVNWQEI